jgi:sigma-B regulation protein RsbU (phosphoserine phosphatase)
MTAGLRDRLRMRQSLALAMEVQKCLLPSDTPIVEGLDIAGHSTYCDETGGDYYDYLDVAGLSRTTAVVAVGDVVGHGVAAAMLMATARGILRSRCEESGSLADLLTHMNTHLARDVGDMTGRFMTMLLMTLDAERRQLRWASAGHDPPLLYDPAADRFIELEGGGLPLGVLAEEQYTEYVHAAVQPHQICFVGTDGVWEAADATGALFGKARVTEVLRAHAHESADAISHALRAALETFRGGVKQADDVTFVILKVK